MAEPNEIELVFEPQDEGGYHVYAPELPGLHTQGEDLDDAIANAEEALALYVEGLREEGESLEFGVIRRRFPLPAWNSEAASEHRHRQARKSSQAGVFVTRSRRLPFGA